MGYEKVETHIRREKNNFIIKPLHKFVAIKRYR